MKLPVYLDRDGVINENRADYVRNPSQWIPLPGAVKAVAELRRMGHPVVVVTNQSGIGRGFYSSSDVDSIHKVMIESFTAAGASGIHVYYCPHHPSDACSCRKPETGLLSRAKSDLSLPEGGWLVGDAHTDMELGRRVGLRTILVLTGRGKSQLEKIQAEAKPLPDFITDSIVTALDIIRSGQMPLQDRS